MFAPILWASIKKKLFIMSNLSFNGLATNSGISIVTGIRLLNVLSKWESIGSEVAEIIITSILCVSLVSPNFLTIPLSISWNSISWPSWGNLCISSINNIPPSAFDTNPSLFSSAPVKAPLTCPNNCDSKSCGFSE